MRGEHDRHHLEQRVDDSANSTILGATALLTCLYCLFQDTFRLLKGGVLILQLREDGVCVKPRGFRVRAKASSGSWRLRLEGSLSLTSGAKRL